jgi:hypothetical protein
VHTKPILFKAHVIREAQAIAASKEASKKANRERIDANKAATARKKEAEAAKKAEKALQAALREDNIKEITAEEKAEQQARKKKEKAQKQAANDALVKAKTPINATKASGSKRKVVWFESGVHKEVVVPTSAKSTKSERAIKPRAVFKQSVNQNAK